MKERWALRFAANRYKDQQNRHSFSQRIDSVFVKEYIIEQLIELSKWILKKISFGSD